MTLSKVNRKLNQGQILTVDDQWNGLRLEKEISVQVK